MVEEILCSKLEEVSGIAIHNAYAQVRHEMVEATRNGNPLTLDEVIKKMGVYSVNNFWGGYCDNFEQIHKEISEYQENERRKVN